MTKARTYNSEVVNELLAETSAEQLLVTEKKMLLAVKIADAVKQKYRHRNEFAVVMGKKPSEITKWLNGTHNFTAETLFEIERVLGIQLLNVEQKPFKIYHISVSCASKGLTNDYWGGKYMAQTYKSKKIVTEKERAYVTCQ